MKDVPIDEPSIAPVMDLAKHRGDRVGPDGTFIPRAIFKHGRFCAHRQVSVNESAREVTCNLCSAKLDPIEVIVMFAREERSFCFHQRELKQQIEQLEKDVEALKRQKANLGAQIRRSKAEVKR